MANFDKLTIQRGVPALELMERAGTGMSKAISSYLEDNKILKSELLLVFVGPGNNGGDGFVLARILNSEGRNVKVLAVQGTRYSEENIYQAKKFSEKSESILLLPQEGKGEYIKDTKHKSLTKNEVAALVKNAVVIIDALLGTGAKEAPKENIANAIKFISEKSQKAKTIALDIPSGINADTGGVFEPCVKADITLTVELLKRGMVQDPAREYCGKIEVISIGIDSSGHSEFSLLNNENTPRSKVRKTDSHKGNFGHVLVVGGCREFPGAPILSSMGALRSGAGLVTLSHLSSIESVPLWPEIMLKTFEASKGFFAKEHINLLKEKMKDYVFVVGPGLGTHEDTKEFLFELLLALIEENIPCVLDADGLNLLAGDTKNRFFGKLSSFVLTPHPGEMSKLLGISKQEVQDDRYSAARTLSDRYNSAVVLKGASSVVYGKGQGFVNTSGNPFMATAGSGDVLSGVVGALLAQGLNPLDAVKAGVYFHGAAGDLAHSRMKGPIIASDIIDSLPQALGIS